MALELGGGAKAASSEPILSIFFWGQDGLHEDVANPGLGAAAVVRGAEFEGAVCCLPKMARADGRHGVCLKVRRHLL
jgi:hypothetical protein